MQAVESPTPQHVYAGLMAVRRGAPVEEPLARMLASWSLGLGVLPDWLGLDEERYSNLILHHFPGMDPSALANPGRPLDLLRQDEMADLRRLLLANRTREGESEALMTDIVIAGCLGDDHLWQDLGLWSRSDLSGLMLEIFAPLARRNTGDMKWKKFLYKQLCEAEGIYTCRAPSCEVCADYQDCFGPED